MNASDWNDTSVNTSYIQQPCCFDETGANTGVRQAVAIRMTLALSLITSAIFLIAVTSGFLNSLLLWGLVRVDHVTLRAKTFLLNLTIVNIALPVVTLFNILIFAGRFGLFQTHVGICMNSISRFTVSILFLIQPICVVGLACDRIYAVAKPIQYKLVGYTKVARVAILLFPWLTSVCIGVGFLIAKSGSASNVEGLPVYCSLLLATRHAKAMSTFVEIFLITMNVTAFFACFAILAILRCNNGFDSVMTSKTLSLTVTYLLTNVTTLALYLPVPLYFLVLGKAVTQFSSQDIFTTSLGLAALYLINACLDPLIFMSRIRSVRNNLPIKQKNKGTAGSTRFSSVSNQRPAQFMSNPSKAYDTATVGEDSANRSVMG